MPKAVRPKLHDWSVMTILHYDTIEAAIRNGQMEFSENAVWREAANQLPTIRESGSHLPVLLADASNEAKGILAWGIAERIQISGGETQIRLTQIKRVPSQPVIWTLVLRKTGEYLKPADQRPYRLVETPPFILEQPATFILTWNPDVEISLDRFRKLHRNVIRGEHRLWNWTCYATKAAKAGDRFIMLRQGKLPRGIVASGWLRSHSEPNEENIPHAEILWDQICDPNKPLSFATIPGAEDVGKNVFSSGGKELKQPYKELVWRAWRKFIGTPPSTTPNKTSTKSAIAIRKDKPNEDPASSVEGSVKETTSSRRERNRVNRKRCIEEHGTACAVCKMDFESEYGDIGIGYIHVHHLNPLGGADDEGVITNPEKDMLPVCPNCHAMLHIGLNAKKGEVRTIADLKKRRRTAQLKRLKSQR
jgi:5-methylcytosine-specific restriction enzyme A